MKKIISEILKATALAVLMLLPGSCTKDLLDQQPTTEVGASVFWKTENDATTALLGAYSLVYKLFDRDYYFDGQAEYMNVTGISTGPAVQGASFQPVNYGNSFDTYFKYLYGGVNRVNYVIENVTKMLPEANALSLPGLERVVGEARLLRGMIYFRLISMWGDVPYIDHIIYKNSELDTISRMPMTQIKDFILADFSYAVQKLPNKASEFGRASKPAALAFRGKMQLYWACWNKFGWPELDGFTPDQAAATAAYTAAAADFKNVIENFGLELFRGGAPGEIDALGQGKILPNYYYLFVGSTGNGASESLMAFPHGQYGSIQGDELMRDFGDRLHENSQTFCTPRYEIADRYQSTVTGDFVDPLIPMNPSSAGARTALNSAVNPASYANRDYRMKSSILWDYEESPGLIVFDPNPSGWVKFIYKTWGTSVTINGVKYNTANGNSSSGYFFRKFVRNYSGTYLHRSWGDFAWPVMRLPDVYLMYAEATNETKGPQADAIALVNKIRRRGNLPPLSAQKTANKDVFFSAIEQERIVELLGEGQRSFDLRRWRALERVWGPPYSEGKWRIDTWGANSQRYFQNSSELIYQKCYIFSIPPSERDRNPNLTQNTPWL